VNCDGWDSHVAAGRGCTVGNLNLCPTRKLTKVGIASTISRKSGHARSAPIPLSVVRTVEREVLVVEEIEIAGAA
jgi:hypothetical protein